MVEGLTFPNQIPNCYMPLYYDFWGKGLLKGETPCLYIHSLLLDFQGEMCYQRTVGLYFQKCDAYRNVKKSSLR
jgi:hypothetical protein